MLGDLTATDLGSRPALAAIARKSAIDSLSRPSGIITGSHPSAFCAVNSTLLRLSDANPDRNVLARRLETQREPALEFIELAVVIERLPGHQQVDDIDVLAESRERRIERNAMEVLDHLRSAGAEANDHAPAAQFIERREMLRQRARRARVRVDDSGCQLDAPRMLGEQRETS